MKKNNRVNERRKIERRNYAATDGTCRIAAGSNSGVAGLGLREHSMRYGRERKTQQGSCIFRKQCNSTRVGEGRKCRLLLAIKKTNAHTVVGRGEEGPLCDPGSEFTYWEGARE